MIFKCLEALNGTSFTCGRMNYLKGVSLNGRLRLKISLEI